MFKLCITNGSVAERLCASKKIFHLFKLDIFTGGGGGDYSVKGMFCGIVAADPAIAVNCCTDGTLQ